MQALKRHMLNRIIWLGLMMAILCSACKPGKLPPPAKPAKALFPSTFMSGDTFCMSMRSSLACPIVVNIRGWEGFVDTISPAHLAPKDSQVVVQVVINPEDSAALAEAIKISYSWGDPATVLPDSSARYRWPFPRGKRYKIMQAYNGKFSHQSDFSRYAVDFDMSVGDTVCAMREGVVVGIIDGNTVGGNHRRYRPYANYITLYHPDGVLSQYVHLHPGSLLVAMGDSVEAGTPLALCGETGFISGVHLHANVLKPVSGGAISIPVEFEQMSGHKLSRSTWVTH